MKKRFTFKCWNCNRTYNLLREITNDQVLAVACPYCNSEGVVDLDPFRKKPEKVMRSATYVPGKSTDLGEELDLPDILPTQKPE
jgi:DNA-directed RNA polymerase subunit RPC12/RpoP